MVLPLIGAALGVVSTVGGLVSSNRQASAQRDTLQVQADQVETERKLTELTLSQQRRLSLVQSQYDAMALNAQRSLGLIQNDIERSQVENERLAQRITMEREQAAVEQQYRLRQADALLTSTNELEAISAQAKEAQRAQVGLLQSMDQANARVGGDVQADSTSTNLEAQNLELGDIAQQLGLLQTQGLDDNQSQLDYELGLLLSGQRDAQESLSSALRLLDLDTQLDDTAFDASATDLNTQYTRNTEALTDAYTSEELARQQAQTANDVTTAAQTRALTAQNKSIQRPGILGTISALGNAGLTAYQGIQAYNASRPTPPPNTAAMGSMALGMVPSPARTTVTGQEGLGSLGLVPGMGTPGVPLRVTPYMPRASYSGQEGLAARGLIPY